jgi:hypothetical protein
MNYKYILILFFVLHVGMVKAQSQAMTYATPANPHYTHSILSQAAEASRSSFSSSSFNQALKMQAERHGLEKAGRVLTFIGVPLLIIGGVMVANSDALYYNCVNGTCEGDAQGVFGVLLLSTGIGMTGTGIVLWTIGSKKTKRMYQ